MSDNQATDFITAKTVTEFPVYPKGTKMCLIEIESISHNVQIGNSGVLWPLGRSRGLVLESDLPLFEGQTQTDGEKADFAFATAQHERDHAKFMSEGLAHVLDSGFGVETAVYAEEKMKREMRWPSSAPAVYHRLFDRDVKPIVAFTVLERGLPNPSDLRRVETEESSQAPLAKAVAEAVRDAMSEQNVDVASSIGAAIGVAIREAMAAQQTGKSK